MHQFSSRLKRVIQINTVYIEIAASVLAYGEGTATRRLLRFVLENIGLFYSSSFFFCTSLVVRSINQQQKNRPIYIYTN